MEQSYPGNIRELRNLLSRELVLADTNIIDHNVIELCLEEDTVDETTPAMHNSDADHWVNLKTNENQYINRVIDAHAGDKEISAEVLGISVRSLYRKLG